MMQAYILYIILMHCLYYLYLLLIIIISNPYLVEMLENYS